jgi:hypothetical protein
MYIYIYLMLLGFIIQNLKVLNFYFCKFVKSKLDYFKKHIKRYCFLLLVICYARVELGCLNFSDWIAQFFYFLAVNKSAF